MMSLSDEQVTVLQNLYCQVFIFLAGDFTSDGEKQFIEYSDEHGTIRMDFLWVSFIVALFWLERYTVGDIEFTFLDRR